MKPTYDSADAQPRADAGESVKRAVYPSLQ